MKFEFDPYKFYIKDGRNLKRIVLNATIEILDKFDKFFMLDNIFYKNN